MLKKLVSATSGASFAAALVLRGTLRIPLTEELTGGRWIASYPSALLIVAVALAGGIAGVWIARRSPEILYPLAVPGLAAAAFIPGMLGFAPSLSALSGPLLDLLLVGSLAAALWRHHARRGPIGAMTANRVAILAFLIYLAVGFRLQETVGLSGDEPHYLLIAYSLLHDGDLAVADNYERQDYREYFSGKMGPHLAHGTPYSVHGVGLPLLLLPGFALWGLRGVLLTEALIGSLLVREVYRYAESLDLGKSAALLASVGFGLTAPALFLCVSAYPELPAALVVVAAMRHISAKSPWSARQAFLWGLAVGCLPFLHIKYIPLAVILGLGFLVFRREQRGFAAAGWIVGLVGLVVFSSILIGSPNPLASYGRQRVFLELVPLGLAGLLFDQEFGLLPASPIYIVALTAFGSLLRRESRLGLLMFGVFAAAAIPGAAHPLWSGGTSPPARFLFPALPLLAVAAAFLWRKDGTRGVSRWLPTLLIASLLLAAFMAFGPDPPLHLNQRDGSGRVWEALGTSWDLTHYLPSIVRADTRSLWLTFAGVVLIGAGAALHFSRFRAPIPPFVALLLGGAIMLDIASPGSAAEGSKGRWMALLLEELPGREESPFFALPEIEKIPFSAAVGMIEVPLVTSRESLESGWWKSRSIVLPAGEYEVQPVMGGRFRLCNGQGCFSEGTEAASLTSSLTLNRFHIRSSMPDVELKLVARDVRVSEHRALGSLRLASGARLHVLDDNVYLDPKGCWIRAGARARIALEDKKTSTLTLSVSNGGEENWVEVVHGERKHRFSLRPWVARRLELSLDEGTAFLTVTSGDGFRPSDLDPASSDQRQLGVFLSSPR